MKNSKIVQYDLVSEQLRRSGLLTNEGKVDMMTESVPFAKLRVNALIHKNKEKIRIAEEYKRFGEGLDNLFKVMRQYKGRDDVDFLADQFVAKERQIQKLGEYIGKLEDRIVSFENQLENRKDKDQKLKEQLTAETYSQSEKEYEELSVHVRQDLGDLKKDHVEMNEWLLKVG